MESMTLFTQKPLTINEIAISAMKAGFKTYFSPNVKNSLMVEFVVEQSGRFFNGTTQFGGTDFLELYATNPELLGDEQLAAIERYNPIGAIAIAFQPVTLEIIFPLLKELMRDYDGLLLSHNSNMYTIDTIKSLMNEV